MSIKRYFPPRSAIWSPKRWSSPPWPVLPLPTSGLLLISFFVFDVCLLFVVDDHMINGQWSLIILVGPSLPNVLSSTSIWSSWSCWSSWSSQLSWLSPQPWELRLREQGSKWAHRRCAWFLTFIWLNFMIKLTLPQASVIYQKLPFNLQFRSPCERPRTYDKFYQKSPCNFQPQVCWQHKAMMIIRD